MDKSIKQQLRKQLQKLLNTEIKFNTCHRIGFRGSYTRGNNFSWIINPVNYETGDSITIGDILSKGFAPIANKVYHDGIHDDFILTSFLMSKYVEICKILEKLNESLYLDMIDGEYASTILTKNCKNKLYPKLKDHGEKIDIYGIEIIYINQEKLLI